ncbi:hypothetical protein EDB87DRAFT_532030 [Lactarius vividus]|nr:hypothetical protein EDB87DRAFT_532030 [Lactarius vividus]
MMTNSGKNSTSAQVQSWYQPCASESLYSSPHSYSLPLNVRSMLHHRTWSQVELSTRILGNLDTYFFVIVQEATYSSRDTESIARDVGWRHLTTNFSGMSSQIVKVRVSLNTPGNVCNTPIHYHLNHSFPFARRRDQRIERGCDRCPLCTSPLALGR